MAHYVLMHYRELFWPWWHIALMWPWHHLAWTPGPQDSLALNVFLSADLHIDLMSQSLWPWSRTCSSVVVTMSPSDTWICVRRLCMRPVCFKNTKECTNISGSVEGHGAMQGRGIGIYSPSRSGIKLSPFLSWRSCEGCLRGKWQPADSSKHFPHSVTATESAYRRVCCLGNGMTLDPAVDVLGFLGGRVGPDITCSPHLSYHEVCCVICHLHQASESTFPDFTASMCASD